MYVHHIVQKDENELIKQVFKAQNANPTKGDFCELLKADMDIIGQIYDAHILAGYYKSQFKVVIQKLLNEEYFEYLKSLQLKHKKKDIVYKEFKIQPYISESKLSNKMKSVLFAMRSSMTRGIRKKLCIHVF